MSGEKDNPAHKHSLKFGLIKNLTNKKKTIKKFSQNQN